MLAGLWLAGSLIIPRGLRAGERSRISDNAFTLGVASGSPARGGFVLWTRLAPTPLSPDGGMAKETVPVTWEVAADEHMRNVRASGVS